jgi:hypothetical protein
MSLLQVLTQLLKQFIFPTFHPISVFSTGNRKKLFFQILSQFPQLKKEKQKMGEDPGSPLQTNGLIWVAFHKGQVDGKGGGSRWEGGSIGVLLGLLVRLQGR